MAKKTVEQMCDEKYDDPEVAKFVAQQVQEAATGDKILSGERVLPHPDDAERNYRIANGTFYTNDTERKQADRISQLEARLQQLEGAKQQPPPKGK